MPTDAQRNEAAEPRWFHLAHEADIGVHGTGPDVGAAFEQAALALTAVITDEPVAEEVSVAIRCSAPDPDTLLYDWLNAIVFEMATRDLLFGRYEIAVTHDSDWRLTATAFGEPLERERHAPRVEVKGATYTGLSVARDDDGTWHARCIVDV